MNRKKPKRKGMRGRFKRAVDAQDQLYQVADAQELSREGTLSVIIRSIKKSEKRSENMPGRIRNVDDANKRIRVMNRFEEFLTGQSR